MSFIHHANRVACIIGMTLLVNGCAGGPGQYTNKWFHQSKSYDHEKAFQSWLKTVRPDAIYQGVSPKTVDQAFSQIRYRDDIIELDQKQPDVTRTFDQYISSTVSPAKIEKARQAYADNKLLIDDVSRRYGVQPQYIVSLWGVESNFGANMGKFPVVESLAVLAFEGRRRDFFKGELINALKILDQGDIGFDDMKGSWAGAMGQTQFMPSSFFSYAVDFNKDGKKDIWTTKDDAFASIANYLSSLNWNRTLSWGKQVKLPQDFNYDQVGLTQGKTVRDWKELGVKDSDGSTLDGNVDTQAWIVVPDKVRTPESKAYLVYSNYKVIMKWNKSTYFATSVGLLADAVANH
ncbi:MAG: lytic murein transglycosylase [Alphaproteobacteria bacterium]|nr:lytic murein transglycosylase [Alphaproteobacteria bacterium]